jgi:hypothetical protein
MGSVAGWVLPCPLSLLMHRRRGGDKGQPLQMTNQQLSYVLSSMFPGPYVPNMFSPHQLETSCLLPFPLTFGPISTFTVQSYTKKAMPP